MKTVRQTISLLLTIVLLFSLCCGALAQPEETEPELEHGNSLQLTNEELQNIVESGGSITFTSEILPPSDESQFTPPTPAERRAGRQQTWDREYYRSQLSEAAQAIYDFILASDLKDGPVKIQFDLAEAIPDSARTVPGTTTVNCEGNTRYYSYEADKNLSSGLLWSALDALLYDHPELSWLFGTSTRALIQYGSIPTAADSEAIHALKSGEKYILESQQMVIKSLSWGMDETDYTKATTSPEGRYDYADTGNLRDIQAAITAAKQDIGTLDGNSVAEKIEAIHDWLCNHAEYADKNSARFLNNWRGYQTAYSTLVEGITVCAGYSKAFKLLCDEYNIPCVVVTGESHGEGHAWNYVQLSGRWYSIDATWADQTTWISRDEYLKGSRTFFQDHTEGNLSNRFNFTYPTLNADDFDPASELEPPEHSSEPVVSGRIKIISPLEETFSVQAYGLDVHLQALAETDNGDPVSYEWQYRCTQLPSGKVKLNSIDEAKALLQEQPMAMETIGYEPTLLTTFSQGTVAELVCVIRNAVNPDIQVTTPPQYIVVPPMTITPAVIIKGDANEDGTVDLADLAQLVQVVNGNKQLQGIALLQGDMNGNSTIDTEDLILLAEVLRKTDPGPNAAPGNALYAVQVEREQWIEPMYPGQKITIILTGYGEAVTGKISTNGLKFISTSSNMSDEDTFVLLPNHGLRSVSYTYQVIAGPGEISVTTSQVFQATDTQVLQAEDAQWFGTAEWDPSNPLDLTFEILDPDGNVLPSGSDLDPSVNYTVRITSNNTPVDLTISGNLSVWGGDEVWDDDDLYIPLMPFTVKSGEVKQVQLKNLSMLPSGTFSMRLTDLLPVGVTFQSNFWTGTLGHISIPPANSSVLPSFPAPVIPEIIGFNPGFINSKPYYVKVSGASTMYYLKSSSGRMARVSAPSVAADNGIKYYPIKNGSTVLFPRLEENGQISCFCEFRDGQEIPVLSVTDDVHPQTDVNGYQTGKVNGKPYYVKVSGASTMFYLKSSSGRMARVSAPSVTAENGVRYYPVNYGGVILFPKLTDGKLTSYVTGSGENVLELI